MVENEVVVEINSRFNDSGVQKALQAVSKLGRVFENSFKQFNFPDMGKQFKDMFKQFESVDPTKAMTKLELFNQQTIADQNKSRINLQETLAKARIKIAKKVEKALVKAEEKIQKGFKDSDKALSDFGMRMLGVGFFAKMLSMEMKNLFQEQSNVTGISLEMAKAVGGGLFDSLNEATASTQLFGMALLNDSSPAIKGNLDWVNKLREGYEKLPGWIRDIIGNMAGFIIVFGDAISMLAFTVLGLSAVKLAFFKSGTAAKVTGGGVDILSKAFKMSVDEMGYAVLKMGVVAAAIIAIGLLIYGLWDIVSVYMGKKIPSETNVVAQAFFIMGLGIADVIQKMVSGISNFAIKFSIAINKALIKWQEYKTAFGGDMFGRASAKITRYMNNIIKLEAAQDKMQRKTDAWVLYRDAELAKFSGESDKINTAPTASLLSNNTNNTSESNLTLNYYGDKEIENSISSLVTQANNIKSQWTDYGATPR